MARYQVILAYDGTQYQGFQRLKRSPGNAEDRSIQAACERALHSLGWQGRAILAAGRTDAGVHASGQVIAFDLEWRHSPSALLSALNAYLPADIAARKVKQAAVDFHPRYDAGWRSYRYQVYCQPQRNPLLDRYAWQVWPPVDPELLQQAAVRLSGNHDFGAFGSPPKKGGGTVRSVYQAAWRESRDDRFSELGLIFEIQANGFLYHMVRRLVYLQVRIGQGKVDLDLVERCLERPDGKLVKGLAPPQGLCLVGVGYEPEG